MNPTEVALREARVSYLRWRLAALDRARAEVAALESGVVMSEVVGPAAGRRGLAVPWEAGDGVRLEVPAGFAGASVREIGERYAVGELSEAQVHDQLVRWCSAPGADVEECSRELGMLLVDELIDVRLHRRVRRAIA